MYDEKTLEKIMNILRDENAALEQMVQYEEQKCNLLMDEKWPAFSELDAKQDALVEKLNALEKERLYTGHQMIKEHAVETLSDLIMRVEEKDKSGLLQLQHNMTAIIHRLQFLKSVTQSIIRDKKELFEVTMQAARGESDKVEYTEKGESRPMDAKRQQSILFNRSV